MAVVFAVVLAGAWWVLGGASAFSPTTVKEMLAQDPQLNPVEATSELCQDPRCVEGWRTDLGSFLRFSSAGEAEYWVTVLGDDGRRYKGVVLDMREVDLTFEQRRFAIDVLFSAKDWF